MGKKIMIGAGIVALLVIVFLVVGMMLGNGEPEITATPTASGTMSASATPSARTLDSYFSAATAPMTATDLDDLANLWEKLDRYTPLAGQSKKITADVPVDRLRAAFTDLPLTADGSPFQGDFLYLIYGQAEAFDDAGMAIVDTPPTPRMVMIWEVANVTDVKAAMSRWETSGASYDWPTAWGFDITKVNPSGFMDGTYKQVAIRYLNFPFADKSIDYSFVKASNGKDYLVVSSSRESMFWAIDTLLR